MPLSLFFLACIATLCYPLPLLAAHTLYGQAHASVDWVNDGSDENIALSNNLSRVGLKGDEAIGVDLQAIYRIEWGVDLTDNNDDHDLALQRARYIGLRSPAWGTLFYGRHETPLRLLGETADLFWHSQLGQNRTITALGSGSGPGFDLIVSNVIAYLSPRIGGVQVIAAYSPDHDLVDINPGEDDDSENAFGLSVTYHGAGPLSLGLGFEAHGVPEAALADIDHEKALRAVAKHDHAGLTWVAFAQYSFDEGFIRGNDRLSYGLGTAYRDQGDTFKVQWYRAQTSRKISENGGWLLAAGVDHAFTEQFSTYVVAAFLKPDANAHSNQAEFEFDTGLDLGAQGHFETHPLALDRQGRALRQFGLSLGMRLLF